MNDYLVGLGLSPAGFDVVTPQPRSEGIKATRRTVAGDGSIYEECPYIELLWDTLDGDDEYRSVLDQFGLLGAPGGVAVVTVRIRTPTFSFAYYEGLAVAPEIGKDIRREFFPRDLVILIRNLVRVEVV